VKRISCLALLLLFLLCACSASGSYVYTRKHISAGTSSQDGDGGISTRDGLTAAITSMMRTAVDIDTLRIYDYQGDLDADLESITNELTKVYPFGVYGVSSIVFKQVSILSRTELSVSVQYSRAAQEITSVLETPTADDLALRISEAFSGFSTRKAFYLDNVYVVDPEALVERCWLQDPTEAVGLKSYSMTSYPQDGASRILELSVEYLDTASTLQKQRQAIRDAAASICAEFSGESDRDRLDFVYSYLKNNVTYDTEAARVVSETGGRQAKTSLYTAYGALLETRAAQSGIVLAAKALCDGLGLNSTVVSGTLKAEPYVWLVVNTDEGQLFFDPTSQQVVESPRNPDDSQGGTPAEPKYVYLFSRADAFRRFLWNKVLYGVY